MIFDKLENGIKHTHFKHLLESIFGGGTCSQLICSGCGKTKERYENFFNMSLPIKNISSLEEAFKKFILGENISDYFCENCNKKQDTTKLICLSKLPNTLIIHLQRIVFDLDTY